MELKITESVLIGIPYLLIILGFLPSKLANKTKGLLYKFSSALFIIFFSLLIGLLLPIFKTLRQEPIHFELNIFSILPLTLSYYFNEIFISLGILISFLGFIVLKYSKNYLEGEENQGNFYKWVAMTSGAILSFVSSNHLIILIISWFFSSYGLHKLLTFYSERKEGLLSAWKKFYISRLGDIFLIIAAYISYKEFQTFQLDVIFKSLSEANPEILSSIGIFFALGALTKSAQFPFHTWLPDTMESPTPVSALMHAGIINAGGVLMIKVSPILNQSIGAQNILILIGGFTAVFASFIMLTETSIKKSLAYSTISQMGLMILQCGLGAYSLALIHILGHSFYKAYSFLSSGSIMEKETHSDPLTKMWDKLSLSNIGVSIFLALVSGLLIQSLFNINLSEKPGILVLGTVFFLSLVLFFKLRFSFQTKDLRNILYSIISMLIFTGIYTASFLLADKYMEPFSGKIAINWSNPYAIIVLSMILISFLLQITVKSWSNSKFGYSFYIHTRNGYYLDLLLNKFIKPFTPLVANNEIIQSKGE